MVAPLGVPFQEKDLRQQVEKVDIFGGRSVGTGLTEGSCGSVQEKQVSTQKV